MLTPLRVLLIEGSRSYADSVVTGLREAGYDPSCCHVQTVDALERALTQEWELVLCDSQLRDLAAADALARLRARHLDAPVIVISNDPRQDGAVAAMKAGADDFVLMDGPTPLSRRLGPALRDAEVRRVRQRAEHAMRESGERFLQAFMHAPIGMAIVGIDGITLQVNRAFCEMFGYSEVEMAGMPVWRVTHPDDMPATIEQLQRLVEGDTDAWYLEKRFFHRDGRMIWAQCSTWLVRGSDGLARYVVSHLQDCTRQKQIEEQMQRQQGELAHVLRVATMGEMVAQIAHEINQPLASIANFANGLATRLERGMDDVEAMRGAALHIAGEALRASDVIRRLRDFLRKGEGKREACEANTLVRDALRLIEPEIRRHAITLQLDLASSGLCVEVDRVQVEQVVLNLLRNAIEALAATDGGRPRQLRVQTAARADATVLVSVCDSGLGLPDAAGARIFEAFFTTKKHGLGLGLSISRSIIEAHDGRLWAEPNAGDGATFAFTLPAATT